MRRQKGEENKLPKIFSVIKDAQVPIATEEVHPCTGVRKRTIEQ